MPPADLPDFPSRLPQAAREALPLSLVHRLMRPVEGGAGGAPVRRAESAHYRAAGYACVAFHKPVTRTFGGGEG